MTPSQISSLLLNTAYGLFGLFLAACLIDAMPPALLDSGWIATTAASLVNFAALPLMGLLLVHVAAYFTPTPQFETIQARLSRLAAAAALGFLLLAPLLGVLVLNNSQTINRTNAKARLRLSEQSNQLRRAVSSARTPAELQAAMVALKGPTLDAASLAKPLPGLKQELLAVIDRTKAGYLAQLQGAYAPQNWPVLKVVLRTSVQCIVASLAFAALSWSQLTGTSLLGRLTSRVSRSDGNRPSLPGKLRALIARLQERFAFRSQLDERRRFAKKEEKRRALEEKRIRQEEKERIRQARLYHQNAEKMRRRMEKEANLPRRDSDGDPRP